jgi:hypothetical protein
MGDDEKAAASEQAADAAVRASVRKRKVVGARKVAVKKSKPQKAPEKEDNEIAIQSISLKMLAGVVAGVVILYLIYAFVLKTPEASGPGASSMVQDETNVTVALLNDARCGDCDLTQLKYQFRRLFPNVIIKEYDVNSAEGSRLFRELGLTMLPAALFDRSVTSTGAYSSLSRYLEPVGDYLSLRIGANWDPYCDPTTAHCGEARCKERLSCRQEVPGKLDLYVMSQCPYGMDAMNSMKAVLGSFGDELTFSLHYIGGLEGSGEPSSLHGQGEVDEDIRALCAMKYYPDNHKYMDYIWCRNKDVQSSAWEKCATDNGMDSAKIKACADGADGKALLVSNIKESTALKMLSSPTFLINNRKTFNALSPAEIQAGICGMNPGLKGCGASLSNQSAAPTGGSCG